MEQWAIASPEMVEHLAAEGVLRLAAIVAQERAKEYYGDLIDAGENPWAAQEMARMVLWEPSPQRPEVSSTGFLAIRSSLTKSSALDQPPADPLRDLAIEEMQADDAAEGLVEAWMEEWLNDDQR